MAGVAGKFGRTDFLGEIVPCFVGGGFARSLPRGAGGGFLLGHGGIEPGAVDRHPARPERVLGEIVGEAEGVVELERRGTGQFAALTH